MVPFALFSYGLKKLSNKGLLSFTWKRLSSKPFIEFGNCKLHNVKSWAIYLVAADKGGISALSLSKHIGVSWPTARNMLKKIRTAMAHLDSIYRLFNELIELYDTYVGGKKPGKRGRCATGKKPVLVAVENRGKAAGFVAMKAKELLDQVLVCISVMSLTPCGFLSNIEL